MIDRAEVLRRVFGHSAFRPGQEEVVEAILSGRPTLAVMPTGAGKSLCYQLPAVLLGGLTVVVSPLIALIRDQVRALRELGLAAASFTSADPPEERRACLSALRAGELTLLYVAPERFRSRPFLEQLAQVRIELFVIDEAHCISQWGHDFRPEYARLGEVARALQPARVACLTATATPVVQDEIVGSLGLEGALRVVTGFDRENLALEVAETSRGKAKLEATRAALQRHLEGGGSGIVYVATRKQAEEVAAGLAEAGLDAAAYHAGLEPTLRARVEADFFAGRTRVVVATIAFGMGVDKADVRVVVHDAVPSSVDGYYQEVGRAGRDGAPAAGVLLWDASDLRYAYLRLESACPTFAAVEITLAIAREVIHASAGRAGFEDLVAAAEAEVGPSARAALIALERAGDLAFDAAGPAIRGPRTRVRAQDLEERRNRERARLEAMIGYVFRAPCRRRYLVDYFGDPRRPERCGACDLCRRPAPQLLEGDALVAAQMALSCVARMRGRWGKQRVADVLLGASTRAILDAGLDQLTTHGLLAGWPKEQVLALLDALIRADLARVVPGDYPRLMLASAGADALRAGAALRLDFTPRPKPRRAAPSAETPAGDPLFEALRTWRAQAAKTMGKPAYVVAHDALLARVSSECPASLEDLGALPGMGPVKLERWGAEILAVVARHRASP